MFAWSRDWTTLLPLRETYLPFSILLTFEAVCL